MATTQLAMITATLLCLITLHSSNGFRLSVSNQPNLPGNRSPFGQTINLRRSSTNADVPNETATSISSSLPPFRCPRSMFRCAVPLKSNALFQQTERVQYMCIDLTRVCDRVRDCPNGEDEEEMRCPRREVKPTEPEGCYLCQGTADQCIAMTLLCNGHADCPHQDDEHVALCHRQKPPQSIASGTSSFSTNQFAPTNISIINTVPDRDLFDGGRSQSQVQQIQKRNTASEESMSTWPISPEGQAGGGGGVRNGVGFMFRVDNLVIYNSQVKMFNQNSENIAPADEEAAANATAHRGE